MLIHDPWIVIEQKIQQTKVLRPRPRVSQDDKRDEVENSFGQRGRREVDDNAIL